MLRRLAETRFAIAAALATMDVLEREGIAKRRRCGEHIMNRLRRLAAKHSDLVGDVRGRGLMIGIEIVKDKKATRRRRPLARPHR